MSQNVLHDRCIWCKKEFNLTDSTPVLKGEKTGAEWYLCPDDAKYLQDESMKKRVLRKLAKEDRDLFEYEKSTVG